MLLSFSEISRIVRISLLSTKRLRRRRGRHAAHEIKLPIDEKLFRKNVRPSWQTLVEPSRNSKRKLVELLDARHRALSNPSTKSNVSYEPSIRVFLATRRSLERTAKPIIRATPSITVFSRCSRGTANRTPRSFHCAYYLIVSPDLPFERFATRR